MEKKIFIDENLGITILLSKQENESDEHFYGRGYFILKYIKHNKNTKIDELIKMSMIWKNIKYLNCEYSKNIMEKISSIE